MRTFGRSFVIGILLDTTTKHKKAQIGYNTNMKTAYHLIQHLYQSPSLRKLREHHLLKLLFERFFPSLAPKVFCFKLEPPVLKIAVRHPAYIKEFKYHENTIKKALKAIKTEELSFANGIEKLIVFDSRYVPSRNHAENVLSDSDFRYCENADGAFENLATDSDIARLFEEWRTIVLRHHRLELLDGKDDFYRRINE